MIVDSNSTTHWVSCLEKKPIDDRLWRADCSVMRATLSIGIYSAMSLSFFNGLILTMRRAGFALNMVASPVNGLMPLRALVAGFLITRHFNKPGNVNSPTAFLDK